jgi:hypothetical protein
MVNETFTFAGWRPIRSCRSNGKPSAAFAITGLTGHCIGLAASRCGSRKIQKQWLYLQSLGGEIAQACP